MKIKNYRDWLALFLAVIVFPAMWILAGFGIVTIPEVIVGAMISIETLIAQFYFRKSSSEEH